MINDNTDTIENRKEQVRSELERLSNETLLLIAKDFGIDFDWSKWLSPRFQLVEAIMEKY